LTTYPFSNHAVLTIAGSVGINMLDDSYVAETYAALGGAPLGQPWVTTSSGSYSTVQKGFNFVSLLNLGTAEAFGADEIIVNYNGSQLTFSNLYTVTGPTPIGWNAPPTTVGYSGPLSGATFSYLMGGNSTINNLVGTAKSILTGSSLTNNVAIHGGGVDTVVFSKASTAYTITQIAGSWLGISDPSTTEPTSGWQSGTLITGGVQAIQFPDRTFFVASTTPLDAVDPNSKAGILAAATNTPIQSSGISTASIVELYAAALNRIPDASGLAAWTIAARTSKITTTQLAHDFLGSQEYLSTHTTPQTDAQFVTSLYNNLLHRAPEAGAVDWYVVNAIPKGRDFTLTMFSGSQEFLNDVLVTPTPITVAGLTSPTHADAAHWLFLG
jgi:hypothetical protein